MREGIRQYFEDKKQAIKVSRERSKPIVSIYAGQMYFVPAPYSRYDLQSFLADQRKVARHLGKPMPRVLKAR